MSPPCCEREELNRGKPLSSGNNRKKAHLEPVCQGNAIPENGEPLKCRRVVRGILISRYAVATRCDLNWCTGLFRGRVSCWLEQWPERGGPTKVIACFAIVTLSRLRVRARMRTPSPAHYRLHAVKMYYQVRRCCKI